MNAHVRIYMQVLVFGEGMASKKTGGDDISEIAGRMWEFLDKLAASDPVEYKKFIDQQLEDGKHMFIPPDPAYCLHCQVRAWVSCSLSLCVCVCVPATFYYFYNFISRYMCVCACMC